ncbi:hypothetical protein GGTG_13058 [Gaeumannomyces tritici R3-111a-1]|uniref:Uncharacterized protein n=1 Tax=Gaeumannomyces tritici (strain R3-111a-1) TaxID=644352 RepID=J3PHS7_GAET3|nr:hypothetical protein GGTG_13058 [Gaeumannomyces tritici R3-111a-1]EJT69439.1 hypothetical protein GGTG_13058 [Gaeumannomyces tritici R3-111a-1]
MSPWIESIPHEVLSHIRNSNHSNVAACLLLAIAEQCVRSVLRVVRSRLGRRHSRRAHPIWLELNPSQSRDSAASILTEFVPEIAVTNLGDNKQLRERASRSKNAKLRGLSSDVIFAPLAIVLGSGLAQSAPQPQARCYNNQIIPPFSQLPWLVIGPDWRAEDPEAALRNAVSTSCGTVNTWRWSRSSEDPNGFTVEFDLRGQWTAAAGRVACREPSPLPESCIITSCAYHDEDMGMGGDCQWKTRNGKQEKIDWHPLHKACFRRRT